MQINFLPLSDASAYYNLSSSLPDIIDIRFCNIGLAFYLFPISEWSWSLTVYNSVGSMNSLTPVIPKYCYEIQLANMLIEYVVI